MINILIVGISRADYWLMKSLFLNFNDAYNFNVNLLISNVLINELEGNNKPEFDMIRKLNGVDILRYEKLKNSAETFISIQNKFNSFIQTKSVDLIVVLGDRYETLAIAQLAFLRGIDVAHISGGETTLGSKDNEFRKCITLCSKLHFPARENHAKELEKLGVDMKNTAVVGYMAIDNIGMHEEHFVGKNQLFNMLGINTDYAISVVTYHPNTKNPDLTQHELSTVIKFMESEPESFFIITAANNDDGGVEVNEKMYNWTLKNTQKSKFFYHIGSLNYFNLLKYANCLIGNSSSGLTEAPILDVPVVNIGDRQLGRLREGNIYDCEFSIDMIKKQYLLASKFKLQSDSNQSKTNFVSPSKLIFDFLKNFYSLGIEK